MHALAVESAMRVAGVVELLLTVIQGMDISSSNTNYSFCEQLLW